MYTYFGQLSLNKKLNQKKIEQMNEKICSIFFYVVLSTKNTFISTKNVTLSTKTMALSTKFTTISIKFT